MDVVDTVMELGMKGFHVEVVPDEVEAVACVKDAGGAAVVADAWDVGAEDAAVEEEDGIGRAVDVVACVDAVRGCGEAEADVDVEEEADEGEMDVDEVEHGGVVDGAAADPKVLAGEVQK